MPVSATLSASFGGFDLTASFSGLGSVLDAVDLPVLSFAGDVDAGGLSGIGLDDVVGALDGVLGGVDGLLAAFPDLAEVIAPVHAALELVELVSTADLEALVGGLGASVAPEGFGLPAVLGAAGRLGEVPAVAGLVDLLGPIGLDLRAPGTLIGGPAGGAVSLVQLVGALLGVETASREIERRTALVAQLVAADRVRSLAAQVGTGAGARLAGLLAGIDPDDPLVVDIVARPIEAHLGAVRELLGLLVRGMAFAEATLVDADIEAQAAGLTAASLALSGSAVAPVGALVATISGAAAPFLAVEVPSLGGDAVWGAAATLASQLQAAIDGVRPDALHQVVAPVIDPVLAPVHAVRAALDQLDSIIRTALEPIRQAIEAIDLTAVERALDDVVQPLRDGVDAVSDLVDGAQAEIEGVVGLVDDALSPVRQTLLDAVGTVMGPFTSLSDAIEALDLVALQQAAEDVLTSVGSALSSIPIEPVFDVATGVIDTAADALGLVPRALLPDDLKAALEAACAPVESLDLEPLRTDLHLQLTSIIEGIDASALDAVQAGYAEVMTFIESVDPRPHVEQLEHDAFDALASALDSIDPTSIMAPVEDALVAAREALGSLDPRALLQPAEDALDAVHQALASVAPEVLLAPVDEALAGVRTTVDEALALSTWGTHLDVAEAAVDGLVQRFDPAPLFDAVRASWGDLVALVRPRPGDARLVPSLVGAALAGSPFPVNPAGFGEVLAWIRDERDGATVVRERLARAAATMDDVHASLGALDVPALVTELDQGQRALVAAVEALPPDSILRSRLGPALAESSPTPSLGLVLAHSARVGELVGTARGVVAATTPPDRSEVSLVATGLGAEFRPLQPVVDHARDLVTAVGADPDAIDPRDAVAELLVRVGPDAVIGPFESVATALLTRVVELVRDGIFAPLRGGVDDLEALLGTLDVAALVPGLADLHGELLDAVDRQRPTTLLAGPLAAFDEVAALLDGFDPLAPVQAAVDALRAIITGFVDDVRPTSLLAPVLDLYDDLAGLVGSFDVAALLEPVLTTLRTIGGQIDHGMDEVIDALAHLQDACESDGGPIPGLDLSVAASVDVGGGFGLSSLLQPAAVVALANARLRDASESLQRKLDATTVNTPSGGIASTRFSDTERRVLGLVRAASEMMGAPDPVALPSTSPLAPGPSGYAILGSAGFELPAYADLFAPGGGWRTDFMRRGTADPHTSLVEVPSTPFALELARLARAQPTDVERRRAQAFTLGVLGAVAHGVVMSPVHRGAAGVRSTRDWTRHDPGTFLAVADAQALRRLVGTADPVQAWRGWWPSPDRADPLWDLYLDAVAATYPFESRPDSAKGFASFEDSLRTGAPFDRERLVAGYERMLSNVVPWSAGEWFGVLTPILLTPGLATLIARALPHASHFMTTQALTDRSFSELITLSNGLGAVTPFIYSMIMWANVPDNTEPFANALALFLLRLGLTLGWLPTIGTEDDDPSPAARWLIAGSLLGADVYAMVRSIVASSDDERGAATVFGMQTIPGIVTVAALTQAALVKGLVSAVDEDAAEATSWATWAVTTVGLWLGAGLPTAFALAKGGGWLSWFFRSPPDSLAAAATMLGDRAEPIAAAHLFDDSTLWHAAGVDTPTFADLRYPSGARPILKVWWTGSGSAEIAHDGHLIRIRHDGTTTPVQVGPGPRDPATVAAALEAAFPGDLHAAVVDAAPVYDLPWPASLADPGDTAATLAEHADAAGSFVALPGGEDAAYVVHQSPRSALVSPFGLTGPGSSSLAGVRVVPRPGLGDVDDTGLGAAADLAVLLSMGAASHLADVVPPTPAPDGLAAPPALGAVDPVAQVFRRWNLDERRVNEWREIVSGGASPDLPAPAPPAGTTDGRGVAEAMGWVPLWRAWLRVAADPLADASATVPSAYTPTATTHDGRTFRPTNAELTAGIRYLLDLPA